jgi:hypothetical protein
METAIYKGKQVEVVNHFHYSADRWWVKTIDGSNLPDSAFSAGSVWCYLLKDLQTEAHPVNEAQSIERKIDQLLDPRTSKEIELDRWQAETQATRESDYPR